LNLGRLSETFDRYQCAIVLMLGMIYLYFFPNSIFRIFLSFVMFCASFFFRKIFRMNEFIKLLELFF